jgi:hypothetical protein
MNMPGFTAEASLYRTSRSYLIAGSPNHLLGSLGILPQLQRGSGPSGVGCNSGCKALCELQFDLDEQDCWDNFKLYDCVEMAERKLAQCLDNCGCGPIVALTPRSGGRGFDFPRFAR